MTLYEQRATEIETRITEYEARVTEVEVGFVELRADLDLIKELNPGLIVERPTAEEQDYDKVTYYETHEQTYERLWQEHNTGSANRKEWSNIVQFELQSEVAERLTRYEIQAKGRGFNATPTAQTQTGVLEVAKTLANPDSLPGDLTTTITEEDVRSNPELFKDKLAEFLKWIQPCDKVTPEQIEEIKTSVGIEVGTLLGASVIPKLDDLTNLVSFPNIRNAAEDAICRSVNGQSSCSLPGVANPTKGLKGLTDNLEAKLGAASLAAELNITRIVSKIDDTVHHATWGLEKAHSFASKAWKATHADKVMNALTLMASLHNAAMLSRNLGETLGDLTSQALSTIGIKDSEGSPLNINEAIGNSLNALMTNILGAEVYAGAKETWLRSSRIISSASQIVWTVRSIADSAREVTEWTAENTGKIGNALKKFRVVGEDAYKWMPEKVTATNKWLSKVDKLKAGVDSLDDAASSFSSVLGEVQNIQSEATELKEQGDKFKQNIELIQPNEREDNKPVKDARAIQLAASKAPSSQADVFRGEGESE